VFSLIIFLIICISGRSQEANISCGSEVFSSQWEYEFQRLLDDFKTSQQYSIRDDNSSYIIPVIFHVIHGGQSVGTYPNIDSTQIYSQIKVINQDFNAIGLNIDSYPDKAFNNWAINQALPNSSIDNLGRVKIAGLNVTFCAALKDTSGNPLAEPGINRINYNNLSISNPASFDSETDFDNYLKTELKPLTIWDPKKYFNIWITDKHADFPHGGIATGPPLSGLPGPGAGGTDSTDGVWVYSKAIGSYLIYPQGTYFNNFIRGRVLTHEAGHWLGLYHPNGFEACGTDYCDDTPPAASQHQGNPQYPYNPGSCSDPSNYPDGEMFMNFMDYTAEPFRYMFTQDQVIRMQTAMRNSPNRNLLGTHNLCSDPLSSIHDNKNISVIHVFPNPTNGILYIGSESTIQNAKIDIFNITGEKIFSERSINKVDLHNLSTGIYILKIELDNKIEIHRIIKIK
jgi:hypothetical protein